jgi:hypothetical protein
MTIDEARGHMERRELAVVRTPAYPDLDAEYGQITNVNDSYVFVRFQSRDSSIGVDPAELTHVAALDDRTEQRRAWRAGLRADVGKIAPREGAADG